MSGLQLVETNDVPVFNLTAGKSLPKWLTERKRRRLLKHDDDLRRRVELVQDFDMPTASTHVSLSLDGQYILAAGTYKPRIKCFDVDQLSLKFERHLDCEVVTMKCLSDDFSKLVMLEADRHVEFHTREGNYFKTRIPKYGRDMAYHRPSCDLYLAAAGSEVYRLNLEQGRFMQSLPTPFTGTNSCDFNPVFGLFGCGGVECKLACFDPRTRNRAGLLDVAKGLPADATEDGIPEISKVQFLDDGMTVGIGTSTGQVLLYDLRSTRPMLVKDHFYNLPIRGIHHHSASNQIISVDTKIVKIWDKDSGDLFTAIEPNVDLNDLCVVPDTGLMFLATESSNLMTYFIPSLGPAPTWARYLDTLVDELDRTDAPAVYDDYKFVTRQELEAMGLSDAIGTSLVRAYMHGFFMDIALYHKAKAISEPFAYEEYRLNSIQKKIDEGTADRLQLAKWRKQLPKINRSLAKKLIAKKQKEEAEAAEKEGEPAEEQEIDPSNPLGDDRFGAMFKDPNFQVDQESDIYKLLHPSAPHKSAPDLLDDRFGDLPEDESDPEGMASSDEESSDGEPVEAPRPKPQQDRRRKRKAPKLVELQLGEQAATALGNRKLSKRPLAERVRTMNAKHSLIRETKSVQGGRSMVFAVKKPAKEAGAAAAGDGDDGSGAKIPSKARRGIAALGLAKAPKQKYWRGRPVYN